MLFFRVYKIVFFLRIMHTIQFINHNRNYICSMHNANYSTEQYDCDGLLDD